MAQAAERAFPSPLEVLVPPDCAGWEEMYSYHVVFSDDRSAFEESRFWFQDGVHCPEPIHPFDAAWLESGITALNQANARLFVIPPSLGVEYRLLNGYVYFSANSVTDEATLSRRAELFGRRGAYYYQHWDELYDRWQKKVEQAIRELEGLEVPALPEFESEAVVTEGRGLGTSHGLLQAFERLLGGFDRIWQYHFELLNLGYGAFLALYELCREQFPGIADQTIATMVSGIDVVLWRPDDELRRLARLAVELGVAEPVKGAEDEDELRSVLVQNGAGTSWMDEFEGAKSPWFFFSYGNGLYHHHRSWIDDTTLPIAMIGSYIERVEAGEDISRPRETVIAERDRVTEEHRSRLPIEACPAFDESLALARTVFPHVENHNFYIEHWYLTIFWNKVREFGAMLARAGFLVERDDVFYLRPDEVRSALAEFRLLWSSGGVGAARGPQYWPPIVDERRAIYEAMREWAPPPALGRVPDAITEPQMSMLFGITTERVGEWLESSAGLEPSTLTGFAGSEGVAEGRARVILRVEQLDELEEGEILVAPSTSTSWTPMLSKIAAAVSEMGGVMSHAAIVAREYGLPAVVGAVGATRRIRTGDRLRVDGNAGSVTILERAASL